MDRVPCRTGQQQCAGLNDLASPHDVRLLDRENLVHNIQQQLKCGANRLSFASGGASMQDLL